MCVRGKEWLEGGWVGTSKNIKDNNSFLQGGKLEKSPGPGPGMTTEAPPPSVGNTVNSAGKLCVG